MEFIKHLAIEAGKLTLEGFGRSRQIPKEGPDGYDIATEYDIRTEELVKGRILSEFGEPVLGEEDGLIGDHEAAKNKLWIVDPIDGTFNYQRGLPLYAVSIAYCEGGVPVCGAIALPALDELFFAAKGSGAFLTDGDAASPLSIRVSHEREIARLTISVAGKDTYRLVAACGREGIPWRSLRLLMGAVPSLAYLASGHLDAFVDTSLNLWDCATGDVILQEAGGPALGDQRGISIFPEYVNRRLDGDDVTKFVCLAASSLELFREPLHRVMSAAGFQVKPPG
jgi:fructose-1,6-bisphosphatase/inositol monophosphatase family enzyme